MSPHISHVLLTALLCLLQTGNGQDDTTTITVTPATLTLMPNAASDGTGGQVTILCRASSVDAGDILTLIKIKRVLHTSPNADPVVVAAASLSLSDTDAVLKLTSLQGSATVTGGLTNKTITLILNRANCGDAGMYICNAYAVVGSFNKMYTSSGNLTIEVNPGPITIKPLLTSGTECCSVGQTLRMTCGQFLGVDDNSSQHNWVWEFKDKNAADWQSYAVTGNPTADITQRQPPSTDPCYKRHYSALSRQLTLEDSQRQYRCYVKGSVTGQGVDKAKVHSVGTLQAPGDEENSKNETGVKDNKEKTSQASASNWLAISLGVAGAVACLGVGLGVALHCRKKGSGQQSNPETVMNTGDTAHVGQSGQDPYDAIDDNASEASAASDADTASDAASDVD